MIQPNDITEQQLLDYGYPKTPIGGHGSRLAPDDGPPRVVTEQRAREEVAARLSTGTYATRKWQ